MATRVSVFGQQPTETKELKKIEFVKSLNNDGEIKEVLEVQKVNSWDNIQLLRRSEGDFYDIIMAWDNNDAHTPVIFLGHWNDGIV